MKLNWYLAGLLGVAAVLAACVTINETGEQRFMLTTPQMEQEIGLAAFQDIKSKQKISSDPEANALVKGVSQRLAQVVDGGQGQWEVVVFDDPSPNAFALPGRKIGVNTGILPITQNEGGLAAVIGHEMAHVTLRHGGQRISRQLAVTGAIAALDAGLSLSTEDYARYRPQILTGLGVGTQFGMILPFSRDNEYEADRIGMKYMAQAGYDPIEAVNLWKRMKDFSSKNGGKPPEWMSTHPADENRIRALEGYLPVARQYAAR